MKKLNMFYSLVAALMLGTAFTSCSSDDDKNSPTPPEPVVTYHYDLTVVAGNHGGMSKDKSHITLSVASLSDATQQPISFEEKELKSLTTRWRASLTESITIRCLCQVTASLNCSLRATR